MAKLSPSICHPCKHIVWIPIGIIRMTFNQTANNNSLNWCYTQVVRLGAFVISPCRITQRHLNHRQIAGQVWNSNPWKTILIAMWIATQLVWSPSHSSKRQNLYDKSALFFINVVSCKHLFTNSTDRGKKHVGHTRLIDTKPMTPWTILKTWSNYRSHCEKVNEGTYLAIPILKETKFSWLSEAY